MAGKYRDRQDRSGLFQDCEGLAQWGRVMRRYFSPTLQDMEMNGSRNVAFLIRRARGLSQFGISLTAWNVSDR
jgi:hypothetical protein